MNRTVFHAGAGLLASSVTFVASLVLAGAGWSASSPDELTNSRGHDEVQARRTFASVPLSFEANHGQADPSVRFLSRGREYVLFLTPGEAVLVLRGGEVSGVKRERKTSERSKRAALRMRLVGAKPFALVVGLDELPGKSQYFLGNDPRRWRTHVPQYARVAYRNIYPGIDLIYHGASGQLEYDFVLAPHARPSAITLAFDGVEQLFLDGHGDAVLKTGIGEVLLKKPFLYQETDGVKKEIDGQFVVKGRHELGLLVRFYDSSKPLIIDPTLSYSTYLGGNSDDSSNSLVVDSFGNTYVTGSTLSTNFPTTAGALDTTSNVASDAFVTKLNTTGTALVYSTYLGGTGSDEANALAVDSAGNAYVTGRTGSPNFPTTTGVFQAALGGGTTDIFVAKIMESAGEGGGGIEMIAGSDSGGWCFIATAAYGSPLASEVQVLREFRDRYLVRHAPGRLFVAVYYQFSPPLARMIADSKVLQATVRGALQPVIWWASLALASPPIGLMIVGGGLLAGSIIPVLAFRARRRPKSLHVAPSGRVSERRGRESVDG